MAFVRRATDVGLGLGLALLVAGAPAANAAADGVEPTVCDLPAGDPDPQADAQAWRERDLANMLCATQRMEDEYTHPHFFLKFWGDATPRTYSDNVLDQLREPTRPRATLGQWIAGGTTTDPYRLPADWEEANRGQVQEVSFIAEDGAKLVGRIFTPNPLPAGKLPAVVITTGSIQGYQEMYNWAAEGLAEAGYMVLTYDVQGQGRSETFPHDPDGSFDCELNPMGLCPGVPFQQGYNFQQGTRDALRFLFSTESLPYADVDDPENPNAAGTSPYNPQWALLDRDRVGLAGHSAGAGAVACVGQEDDRVQAIVGWDSLSKLTAANCPDVTETDIDTPALSLTAEYFFNPTPADPASPPDPRNCSNQGGGAPVCKTAAFDQLVGQGVDTMIVQQRSSTHLEFTYVPYILPASRYGERVAMYYTLAWFDRYLKGDPSATDRLIADTFDGSADASSIGAGTYEVHRNVPYEIEGDAVANRLSIYFKSQYSLEGGTLTCADMRDGCP